MAYPFPSSIASLRNPRVVWYMRVVSGYRHGAVELLYEGSIPPRRHLARIFGDQLGLEVIDVRPFCVFDGELIRHYQDAWAHLPRPWIVVNRKSNNSPNKDWMDEQWDQLIASLLNRYTVIEIGAGRQGGDPVQHPNYVELTGRLPLKNFLAAVAAGDLHVGPDSGPVHVAAAAEKAIGRDLWGLYSSRVRRLSGKHRYLYETALLSMLALAGALPLRSHLPEPDFSRARRAGDCVLGPAWIVGDSGPGLASARRTRGLSLGSAPSDNVV